MFICSLFFSGLILHLFIYLTIFTSFQVNIFFRFLTYWKQPISDLLATMSETSCDSITDLVSINLVRTCHCGENARCFTSRTQLNPGRRFYKCPKPKGESCGYWVWEDNFSDNVLVQINELKSKLEVTTLKLNSLQESLYVIKLERDKLKKKLEAKNNCEVIKSRKLKEKY